MAACTSTKDGPGFRRNVNSKSFQRSAAIKQLDKERSGFNLPFAQMPKTNYAATQPFAEEPAVTVTKTAPNQTTDMELILGNQQYYRNDVERSKSFSGKVSKHSGEGIALNFERASVREVVGVVLGDILKQTYIVEPGVEGEVTINSSAPIPRDALIPTLESLLQTQGAVLYKDDNGSFRVAARANLKGRSFVPNAGKIKAGYSLQIIPLRYIPAPEMQKILEPLANPDAFVRVDPNRNLLVLAGSSAELESLNATIRTFDVDVLQGMSVGIYRIKNVEAQVVAKNLDALFGQGGNSPMAGMVKIVPIEHMNSLMMISASADYLREMKAWVDRFDQTGPVAGQQLYVYSVQNGNAEHLADMLNQIFSGKAGSKKAGTPSSLAPGLTPVTVGGDGKPSTEAAINNLLGSGLSSEGVSINADADVKIVADKTNNSLMILSSEAMYRQILEALKRIDIMPMQVQVEASILEVTLSKGMENGVQWYLQNNLDTNGLGVGALSTSSNGFSFSLSGGAVSLKTFVNSLARESKVKVISSPSILVLDNQTAEIRVGDQQPIFTGELSAGAGDTLTTSKTIQYKDTGVSLTVTPHVNSNGMVKMDIQQDITDVGEEDSVTKNRSFLQRKIKSNIAVQSGETIVLGGLIRENQSDSETGIPVLKNLPLVGGAFNVTSKGNKRTELLVLITPTAIKDQQALAKNSADMRDRMKRLMDDDSFVRQLQGMYVK